MKGLRWWVVGLVALAAVINYIDRQAFGALWPDIAKDLFPDMDSDGTKAVYGTIMTVFILSYAVAEAGNWPGAAKANAEWFPTKERAFAQGIFNSGAAIGGIVAYPLIGLISAFLGWQSIFIVVSLLGFLWLIPWFYIVKANPQNHPWLSEDEKTYILSGQKNQDLDQDGTFDEGYNPNTNKLLSHKESWGVIIASAALDPIWWLFIGYIPLYLNEVYGMNVKEIAFSAWVPYVGAMLGAWFGGLLAQNRLGAGWTVDKTRKIVITLGCIIMIPCFFLLRAPGTAINAVLIMAVLLFGFQTAIGNVQTIPSDLFGGKVVGTLSGFAGTAAKLAGAALTYIVPAITMGGNYIPAFLTGGALAIIALLSIWFLCPKIEPLKAS